MRLLFYIATISLLLVGGVFAYFAVQTPQLDTNAKVVIGIEPYAATVAEAKTKEILEQQARLRGEGKSDPEPFGDRLPQEETGSSKTLAAADTPIETAALDKNGTSLSEPVASEPVVSEPVVSEVEPQQQPVVQEAAPAPAAESAEPAQNFSILGASVSGLDAPLQNPEPVQSYAEPEPLPEPESETASAEPALEEQLDNSLASNDLAGTASEPEINQELATPEEPVGQDVAALDNAQSDRLPIEETAPATEDVPEPVLEDTQNAEVQPQPAVPEPEQEPNAKTAAENPEELRATFNAFVASLKEQERKDKEKLALITPPPLPLKRPDNIPAPVRTASLTSGVASTPRVAILLRGLGRNDKNSEIAVTTLPPAISLGFAPYVGSAQQWARQARERGHEVIIQLPFEPEDYPKTNPGPETILTSSNAAVNTSRLRTVLERFDGYNGVTSYYGGKLLRSPDALRPVLEDIKERGLIYVSEPDASQALIRKLAGELGVIYGGADIIVDNYQTNEAIQKNLEELIALARKQGSAIGVAYASRTSIEQLRAWSESVASKGVTLVPVGVLAFTPDAS